MRVRLTEHALILTELLCQVDSLEASIERLSVAIEERMAPYREAIVLPDDHDGCSRCIPSSVFRMAFERPVRVR